MRSPFAALSALVVPLALLFLASPPEIARSEAGGYVNPHVGEESCESCHARVPTKEDGKAGNHFLLKESIDATCHICHKKMCCDMNSLHSFNHRSDFKDWDPEKYAPPKTLPLQGGKITCATCHMHSAPSGPSFKMVRMVKRTQSRIEWSELCKDCHVNK